MRQPDMSGLAGTVMRARRDRSLSLHELSRMADVPEGALRLLEAGEPVPREHAANVALALLSSGAGLPVVGPAPEPGRGILTGRMSVTVHEDGSKTVTMLDDVEEAAAAEGDVTTPAEVRLREEHAILVAMPVAFGLLMSGVGHVPDLVLLGWGLGVVGPLTLLSGPALCQVVEEAWRRRSARKLLRAG